MKKLRTNLMLGGVLLCLMAIAGLTSCNHDLSDHFGVSDNPSPGVTDEPDPLATPLTLEAITAGTIVVNNPQAGMQFSLNGGAKTAVSGDINVAAGEKVAFYGNGTTITKYSGTTIGGSGDGFKCKVYGNIMSLVDETGFATATELSADGFVFKNLFANNTKLTDASGLLLPATKMTKYCYGSMFNGCTSLTAAPELKAETLAEYCYECMFEGCSSLTAAPALPVETLADYCYQKMFKDCSSLTAAPELKATTLTQNCYNAMFSGCKALTAAPALPATDLTNAYYCYSEMFAGCISLTAAPELPAETLADHCYQQMFKDCSSLTAAPELPATTLMPMCYYEMFKGCTILNAVTCLATDISPLNCTLDWLSGVAASGTFTKSSLTTTWSSDASGTNGWTVQDYAP